MVKRDNPLVYWFGILRSNILRISEIWIHEGYGMWTSLMGFFGVM